MPLTLFTQSARPGSALAARCKPGLLRFVLLAAALTVTLAGTHAWAQTGDHGQRGQHGLDEERPRVQGAAAGPKKPKVKPPRALSVFEWTNAATVKETPEVTPSQIGSDAPPTLGQARGADYLASRITTPQQGVPSLNDPDKPASGRMVPVSVFYGGQYQDGGVYLAEPSPLAVSAPAVYAVEHEGDPLGFFTVHDSTREQGGWIGFGLWTALQPGQTAASLFPDKTPESDVLSGKSDPSLDSRDDDDKPTLRHHKAPVKGKKEAPVDHVVVPDPSSDPDRPRLTHKNPDEFTDLPGLLGNPPDVRQTASISDSSVMDERSFEHKFDTPADAEAMQGKMRQLALSLLHPALVPAPGRQRRPAPHSMMRYATLPAVILSREQFGAYELAYQDEPTYVFAAQVGPAASRQYVAVIAVPDVYGKLQVAWSAVTNTAQLGITPRYRLVDAVDADGDGRAEILMESRNQDGRRFVLFQLYRGVAKQVFETEILP